MYYNYSKTLTSECWHESTASNHETTQEFTAYLTVYRNPHEKNLSKQSCRQRKTTNRRLENESSSRNTASRTTKKRSNSRHTAARIMNKDHFPIVKGIRWMKDDVCRYFRNIWHRIPRPCAAATATETQRRKQHAYTMISYDIIIYLNSSSFTLQSNAKKVAKKKTLKFFFCW